MVKNIDTILGAQDILFLIDQVKYYREIAFDQIPIKLDGAIDYEEIYKSHFCKVALERYITSSSILIILSEFKGGIIDMEDIPIVDLMALLEILFFRSYEVFNATTTRLIYNFINS